MQLLLTDIHQQRRGRIPKRRLKPPLWQNDRRLKRGREGVDVLPGLDPGGKDERRKEARGVGAGIKCEFNGQSCRGMLRATGERYAIAQDNCSTRYA